MSQTIGSPLLWIGFTLFVLGMLALDLGVLHRRAHEVRPREALMWSLVWIGLALAFNGGIYAWFGSQRAIEFLTGYLIEKALSVDNIFVFLVLFSYFSVPPAYQHRVLFWGVLGAILLRALFILVGAALIQAFHWIIFVFGGFLILTGIKILTQKHENVQPERNPLMRLLQKLVPTVPEYHGTRFLVRVNGRRYATPLLVVLIAVEATDVVFALDSIPAIFAVTRDPFIVYTSNIFAILGLRSLYFLLAGIMDRFRYLKVGLGLVLAFVGLKMVVSDLYQIPVGISLAVVASLLGASILASLLRPPAPPPLPEHRQSEERNASHSEEEPPRSAASGMAGGSE
jgi:tellurite resistance protein TerC